MEKNLYEDLKNLINYRTGKKYTELELLHEIYMNTLNDESHRVVESVDNAAESIVKTRSHAEDRLQSKLDLLMLLLIINVLLLASILLALIF